MQIKNVLQEKSNLEKIINYYGFANLTDRGNEYRCGIDVESNPTSIQIIKNEHLTANCYSRGIQGDIFTLIMELKNLTFKDVIKDIREILNINVEYTKKISKPNIIKDTLKKLHISKNKHVEQEIYSENILNQYKDLWNKRFIKDGISIETQKKFNIMYDLCTDRIVIPHRDVNGDIVGIIGRANYENVEGSKLYNKYFPLINHKKSLNLYGYSENYKHLITNDTIYIGESEKFVMQLDTMGINNALCLSGSNISRNQCILITRLRPKKVVFCFDEGLQLFVIYQNINKFKLFSEKFGIEIYLMLDKDNKYLVKDSHDSPTDNGFEIWNKLLENCCEKM